MPQSAERILDHATLFNEPEYQELFARKKALEGGATPEAGGFGRQAAGRPASGTL
jgi:nitrogenase molybdenum-iron protein beta chain